MSYMLRNPVPFNPPSELASALACSVVDRFNGVSREGVAVIVPLYSDASEAAHRVPRHLSAPFVRSMRVFNGDSKVFRFEFQSHNLISLLPATILGPRNDKARKIGGYRWTEMKDQRISDCLGVQMEKEKVSKGIQSLTEDTSTTGTQTPHQRSVEEQRD